MNYYTIRFNLFVNSYAGDEIAKSIRYKYFNDFKPRPINESYDPIIEIAELANDLDLNSLDFEKFVLYDVIASISLPPNRIFITPPSIAIPGTYIKVKEGMTDEEILENAHIALELVRKFESGNKKVVEGNMRKQISKADLIKIEWHKKIESKVKELAIEKKRKNKNYEKYGGFIGIAIESIAGDWLMEESEDKDYSDEKFDELLTKKKTKLRTWYDEINKRYRLLSPRQVKLVLETLSQ